MLIVALFVFSLLFLSGSDPAVVLAGDHATADQIARIRQEFGLDKPFAWQFVVWISSVLHGDLGQSLISRQPVALLIQQRIEPTVSLALDTLALSILIAIPLGVMAAWRPGSWIDAFVSCFALVGFSVPTFVTAYVLIFIFSLVLRWLPVQGFASLGAGAGPFLLHIVMPSFVLSIAYAGLIARITRGCMLDALTQEFVRTAMAKGAGPVRILVRHALKNAAVPIVTVIGTGFAGLVGGVVVTETVFSIPGLGRLTVEGILLRDYPVVQGVVLLLSVSHVLVNLMVDLSYAYFDPRIRY
jgi:peptide/nickel transport system permease protein